MSLNHYKMSYINQTKSHQVSIYFAASDLNNRITEASYDNIKSDFRNFEKKYIESKYFQYLVQYVILEVILKTFLDLAGGFGMHHHMLYGTVCILHCHRTPVVFPRGSTLQHPHHKLLKPFRL